MNVNSFSKNGYIILKKAISKKNINSLHQTIIKSLTKKNITKNRYDKFCSLIPKKKESEFLFTNRISSTLQQENLIEKIFYEKKIMNLFTNILGKDLSYILANNLTLNTPDKTNSKENYLFKDWHQEIWSGANISSLQFWTPIFQKNNKFGQIEFIKDSHKWGHIPHQNRKPLNLPKNFKTIRTNLEVGDVIIFATTMMHKSSITKFPRLSLASLVKNFKYKNESFENNRNWKIFSYSELTKIERILGNHYLSPYRVIDLKPKINKV